MDASNPRSLVGATMGARKRAALLALVREKTSLQFCMSAAKCIARAQPEEYARHRAAYRIGERLRPCPGCCNCKPGNYAPMGFMSVFAGPLCDGSGTLPATRSRAATPGAAQEDPAPVTTCTPVDESAEWSDERALRDEP